MLNFGGVFLFTNIQRGSIEITVISRFWNKISNLFEKKSVGYN